MRKILSSIMLVAAAAMASVSCQKEVTAPVNETFSTTMSLNASVEQTKTYLGEDLEGNKTVYWGKDESVNLYVGYKGYVDEEIKDISKFFSSASTDAYDGQETASFIFEITDVAEANSYALGGIYPASAANGITNDNPESFKIALPATQNAEPGKYDPSAYIMVLKPEAVEALPSEYTASFRRAVALNKITLTGVKEAINSVAITAEGKDLAGRRKFNLKTGEEGDIYYGQTGTITVNAAYAPGDIDVWFTSWGAEIAEGESLKVVMKSATKTYTKTITARDGGIKFVEGYLNNLSIDMSKVVGEVSAQPLPFEKDFSDKTGTDGLTELEGFTVSGSVYNASGAIRLAKGSGPGTVTTESLDLSDEFHVIVDATGWDSDELVLTVSTGEQETELELTTYGSDQKPGDFVSYVLNFEPVSNSATVSFTAASGKRVFIQKIEVKEGHAELPSVLTAETPEIMAAAGGAGSFAYTLTNPKEGQELTATTEAEWITGISVNEGIVSYTVGANSLEEPREATITLQYEGVDDVLVTVAQAGYVDPSVIEELTVAEFLDKEVSTEVFYQLTGTIKNLANTTYGNFDLVDETGSVYVYGLKENESAGNQTFANLGLKEGDVVTLIGPRSDYNGTAQVGTSSVKAYYVSHQTATEAPTISFADNTVTIEAETGATIYYTTDGNDPTTSSDVYSAPFEITETKTVKAIAVAEGKPQSVVVELLCKVVNGDVESVEYELLFGANYNSGKISSYTSTWTATNNDFTCTLANWNNNNNGWSYIKAGSKNFVSVATITTKDAVPEALTTVTMTVDAVTTAKINSLKLYVSTDVNFTTKDTYTATAAKGDVVFNISTPVENAYYKIEVDCAKGTSNGLITVSKVVFAN